MTTKEIEELQCLAAYTDRLAAYGQVHPTSAQIDLIRRGLLIVHRSFENYVDKIKLGSV